MVIGDFLLYVVDTMLFKQKIKTGKSI